MSNASSFASVAQKYAELSQRYSWGLMLVYLLLTVGAVMLARTLEIRTDFESLLPRGTPSVAALDESRARTGSTDLYTVAVASPDPEANIRLIKDIAPKIEAWDETEWVQIDQDASFFSEHALLYLPEGDLEKIRDQLKEEIRLEKKLANPFFIDPRTKDEIAADNAKRWAMDRWLAPDLALRLGLDEDLFNSIISPDKLGLPKDGGEPSAEEAKDDGAKPLPPHLKKYLIREDGSVAVLLAKLTQSATDVVKSKELFDRGSAAIAELDLASYHPEMRAEVVGAYSNFNEVKSISNDSTVATITSSILVLLLLIGFFRNAQSVLLLILPMSMGVTWSVGLTAITYGHLNISTLFVFTMLIGMGIDFGIHYYSRIQEEEAAGKPPVEAITQATLHSGR
ncbi:MAG: MMPL family transporter, partial [Myxococcota bacterium]